METIVGAAVVGAAGGFMAGAILFEIVLPGLASVFAARRRARGVLATGEVEDPIKRASVRYVCHELSCLGDVRALDEPALVGNYWHINTCEKCGDQYVLRCRYPFTRLIRP